MNKTYHNHSDKPSQDTPRPNDQPCPEQPSNPTPNREIIKDNPLPDAIEPKVDWERK
ncbi:hypothetical protein QNE27_004637 [Vibrio alginolyticus]|uniref:hypothetical protein n=1 Tax=Vibrio TaxID=662 RepID=UPI000B26A077|nr:hypothetical protein [Vibrio alginolyticus]ELA6794789.1 hypothetical protein [Vibrio alginolyticus]ELA8378649.1 hypothetical protein [Vibrio alginolyticus]ELB2817722.1 hypothetical protein [Vibrio alginolyticus]ELB2822332.1 hypothetical protein [Vibrio alginolyticus]